MRSRPSAEAGEVSPRGRFGREETPQSLVGGWHSVGLSISKMQTGSAISWHFFGNKMQRAPVCPAAGQGAPGEDKWGFICGCSIAPLISMPAVHSVHVPFLMQVDQDSPQPSLSPAPVCVRLALTAGQGSSWGHTTRRVRSPSGPTPSGCPCPAVPSSAGSSATSCTRSCATATLM